MASTFRRFQTTSLALATATSLLLSPSAIAEWSRRSCSDPQQRAQSLAAPRRALVRPRQLSRVSSSGPSGRVTSTNTYRSGGDSHGQVVGVGVTREAVMDAIANRVTATAGHAALAPLMRSTTPEAQQRTPEGARADSMALPGLSGAVFGGNVHLDREGRLRLNGRFVRGHGSVRVGREARLEDGTTSVEIDHDFRGEIHYEPQSTLEAVVTAPPRFAFRAMASVARALPFGGALMSLASSVVNEAFNTAHGAIFDAPNAVANVLNQRSTPPSSSIRRSSQP